MCHRGGINAQAAGLDNAVQMVRASHQFIAFKAWVNQHMWWVIFVFLFCMSFWRAGLLGCPFT
jgi:hypothetical protein